MPIDLSGVSSETAMTQQAQPMETAGVSKALSILDRADRKKTAGVLSSPATALKASRQVGTATKLPSMKGGSLGSKVSTFGSPMIKEPGMATKPKLKVAVALGGEEIARLKTIVLNRADTRAQTNTLFESAKASRELDRQQMYSLFLQAAGAETMAPGLQKEASPTSHIDAFFQKLASDDNLTEAQRRFPELLQIKR